MAKTKPERYLVQPYYDDGGVWQNMVRVYRSKTWAMKRLRELQKDYEVQADVFAWYPDFSKSKGGRFERMKVV